MSDEHQEKIRLPASKKALYALVVMLFVFALAEGAFRIAGWTMLRSRTGPAATGTGARIHCYGDSLTFGLGVAPQASYPAALERALKLTGIQKVRIVNRGVPGSGIQKAEQQIREDLEPPAPPDLVLILVGMNDTPRVHYHVIGKAKPNPVERRLFEKTATYRVLRHLVVAARWRFAPSFDKPDPGISSEVFGDRLAALLETIVEKGVQPIVLSYPEPVNPVRPQDIIRGYLDSLSIAQALAARQANVPFVDLQPPFDERPGDSPWLPMFSTHPNELGYAMMAATMLPEVARALGKGEGAIIDPERLLVPIDPDQAQWPAGSLEYRGAPAYETRTDEQGQTVIESDTDASGAIDYRAVYQDDQLVSCMRLNKALGLYETTEYRQGVRVASHFPTRRGFIERSWYELEDRYNLFEFSIADKDKDGLRDFYAELINGVEVKTWDDFDQDDFFEIRTWIADGVKTSVFVDDIDKNGALDFWELTENDLLIFRTDDGNKDGLPDLPLPPFSALALSNPRPEILAYWSAQTMAERRQSGQTIVEATNTAPDSTRRLSVFENGELVAMQTFYAGGGVSKYWVKRQKGGALLAYLLDDKNRDGVFDHYEEYTNEIITHRQNDYDQDGRWEVWALIDQAGNILMDNGDKDGDGVVDFWALRKKEKVLFDSIDADHDGLPDNPLPPLDTLGIEQGQSAILENWGNQTLEESTLDGRRLVRTTNRSPDGAVRINQYADGELTATYYQRADRSIFANYYERADESTRIMYFLDDKNRDGVFDHYEEHLNGRLVRRRDDDDQDGRWEVWALINDAGTVLMHQGDLNGDGEVDYWEAWDGDDSLYKTIDSDEDGLPDRPLPLPALLGIETIDPLVYENWGTQTRQTAKVGPIVLERLINRSPSGTLRTNEYRDGELSRTTVRRPDGSVYEHRFEQVDDATQFQFFYDDKDRDGAFDHYEERINGRLVHRADDDNQDGRWEVWALIDDKGEVYMHLGDLDGDGAVDYWEAWDGEDALFKSLDSDKDGLPDEPLPTAPQLGIEHIRPEILARWGNQTGETVQVGALQYTRTTNRSPDGTVLKKEHLAGELVHSFVRHPDGAITAHWFEQADENTRFIFFFDDKNRDGVFDHYEEQVNGRLTRRQDDDDQDGRWEVWALIDPAGEVYLHLGDLDGDGRVDYWEAWDGDGSLFKTIDSDADGLPDDPLPWPEKLGIESIDPLILKNWGEQSIERRSLGDRRIVLLINRAPNGNVRTQEYVDGHHGKTYFVRGDGSVFAHWFEQADDSTQFQFFCDDKDRDGVFDHYEERVNGLLVRRTDDDDQDGRWEVWARIDPQGEVYLHQGDLDGDGRVDYWEAWDGDRSLYKTIDSDEDGLPDDPLPPPATLEQERYRPDLLRNWGDQAIETRPLGQLTIVRLVNRGEQGAMRINEMVGGVLYSTRLQLPGGGASAFWFEQVDESTRFVFFADDKNRDGVLDHYEEKINGRLVRRQDDDDQDGRWEVRALIDEAGEVYLHLGDLNGDGGVDYWEAWDGDRRLFKTHDSDADGLPDDPLPSAKSLGLEKFRPEILEKWGNQTVEKRRVGTLEITRATNRAPDGSVVTKEYLEGELIHKLVRGSDGALAGYWYEHADADTLFSFFADDKNRDGIFDHYEERINDRVIRRKDDDDQDGRWEVWALIDEAGDVILHQGDLDGDGRVDYWEAWEGDRSLFKTIDSDQDGLPDDPLPPPKTLGLEAIRSEMLHGWGEQASQTVSIGGRAFVRVTNRSPAGAWRKNEYSDGQQVSTFVHHKDGSVAATWIEQAEGGARFTYLYGDKNGDGRFDHYEERINGRLSRRQDDDDQDGRWEFWALIDEAGEVYLQQGDLDGDGAVDFWEAWQGGRPVFKTLDTDKDGLPDQPLPPADQLGVDSIHPQILQNWGNQSVETRRIADRLITRSTQRSPSGSVLTTESVDGELVHSFARDPDGAIRGYWYEQADASTRFVFFADDKNRDGLFDHYEEKINDRLVRRMDDDDQDGRWEIWAVINDRGEVVLHLGDVNGDGDIDYWELRYGEDALLKTRDRNGDREPDLPLWPLSELGDPIFDASIAGLWRQGKAPHGQVATQTDSSTNP